ncbi:hypothetical protein NP493_149g01002 [Ridgeia piscesae]|uniref:Uncharacterized protein n=1 Tax=Ridgeia piscesae TaxID=27915 RepID=A0AAD9UFW0_RIDPI|nr:hypothetical protein NP493_149g01002 [Ridgeia piscesae]
MQPRAAKSVSPQSSSPPSSSGSKLNVSFSAHASAPRGEALISYMRRVQRQLATMRNELRRVQSVGQRTNAASSGIGLWLPKTSGAKPPKPSRKPKIKARKPSRTGSESLQAEDPLVLPPLFPRQTKEAKRRRTKRCTSRKTSGILPPLDPQTGDSHGGQQSE